MSRHAITATVLLIAAATACSSDGDNSKPEPSTSTSTAGLAAQWGPKLTTAASADPAVCNQVGDIACADHLTAIATTVTELEQAITAAGPSGYSKTTAEIAKVNAAVQAYTDHECLGDENASIQGSPCPDDARTVLAAGGALRLALEADEANG